MKQPVQRRLAAILAADVAGFNSLIEADLGGTLRALKAIRRDLVDPTIEAHNGRLLKTSGDLLLVEFSNVVEALRCATDLQRTVAEHNRNLPAGKRIEFRIGIHQGDVVIQDGYLFGDGVNIATGLEGLAEPGGICLSARAKEDAEGKLAVQFEDMGEQRFKNRSRRVRTYQIYPTAASSIGISERATRRLAAILAADVVGYSRLMGADEEGTHERLKAHLSELVEPKIREHRGRTVKNTGDGLLAEFSSVVDAVRCAAEVQRGMIDREPEVPDEQRIRFRIGINLGDIIVEENDIFGDGVNVAARLEALAEPGGICISGVVRDQIRDKLPHAFEDMGEQSVKNIARPVRAYALRSEALAARARPGLPAQPSGRGRVIIGMVAAAALVVVCIAWWFWPAATFFSGAGKPADQATASPVPMPMGPAVTPIAQPLVAPRLSIVVLPFTNLSNDPDQQYFSDGITEDLTTDLSRVAGMFVIARNTAFTYRDKPVNAKQIGRELGVRYVLEGSVQRSGKQVRITAQLIDAETGGHLWAERFDRDTGDLFALQSEITGRIAAALSLELVSAEAIRPTDYPEVLDYVFRARAAYNKGPGSDTYAEIVSLYEHALALDPRSVEALTGLGGALAGRVMLGFADSPAVDLERAERVITQALAISPRNPSAHLAKAIWLKAQGRCDEAIPEFEMLIALNRNSVSVLANLGQCKIATGSLDEGIALQEQVIRLSPRDPFNGNRYDAIGFAHLLQSRTDEAIVWLEKGCNLSPRLSLPHAHLASAYALKGDLDRASAELAEARRLRRDGRFSSIARLKAAGSWGPKVRALVEATYFVGLRKAGMQEE